MFQELDRGLGNVPAGEPRRASRSPGFYMTRLRASDTLRPCLRSPIRSGSSSSHRSSYWTLRHTSAWNSSRSWFTGIFARTNWSVTGSLRRWSLTSPGGRRRLKSYINGNCMRLTEGASPDRRANVVGSLKGLHPLVQRPLRSSGGRLDGRGHAAAIICPP